MGMGRSVIFCHVQGRRIFLCGSTDTECGRGMIHDSYSMFFSLCNCLRKQKESTLKPSGSKVL